MDLTCSLVLSESLLKQQHISESESKLKLCSRSLVQLLFDNADDVFCSAGLGIEHIFAVEKK